MAAVLTLPILQFSHSPTARQPGFAMVPEAQLEFWSSPCDVRAWCPWIARSKRVQVREQIGHLLLIEDLRISQHHIPAITDNVTNLLIIRGQSALGQRSEEHTSNSSHSQISYAVFCLKKKNCLHLVP